MGRRSAPAQSPPSRVRTPSLVARAVADLTDHHLIAGKGAQDFARAVGFDIEADLNTERSRRLWLEWRRRVDPEHWLDPDGPARKPPQHERDPGFAARALEAGRSMVRDGLIPEGSFWGTINCDGVNANGDICGVTTTSGLAWKVPGRVGDSPILGAGLYVDNDVGAAGSTGRGEANLYNLCSYLIVESMRRGMAPKDAGMEALRRIRSNTVERRLLNAKGNPNFNIRFFVVNKRGRRPASRCTMRERRATRCVTRTARPRPNSSPCSPGDRRGDLDLPDRRPPAALRVTPSPPGP